MRKLELLAPARDPEAARIAVDYGADALYIGGPSFGARAAAGNSLDDVARVAEYARRFRVRVYAALNTLVFEDELDEAERIARGLIAAGVDALIVQDMAFMRMGLTGVELHASTQTCNITPDGVRFLQEAGFSRVILERGLTLAQIRAIRRATDVELECFVHGAICVGFSGQCYLSRSMGPRSGNRGDCMQACRLPYDLVDAAGNVMLRGKHLLSVTDLDLTERLDELTDSGINSFKIEGRLKDDGYVKNVVAHYRRRLDELIARREGMARSSSGRTAFDFTPDPARSFTRGGSEWVLDGGRRGMASLETPKATGAYVGTVETVAHDRFTLSGSAALTPGDGICFLCGGELQGTNVNRAEGRTVWPNKMEGITKGARVFRNFDKAFETTLRQSRTRRTVTAAGSLTIESGLITFRLQDEDGFTAETAIDNDFPIAGDWTKAHAVSQRQLARSGDTIFNITGVTVRMGNGVHPPFMPVSVLNALRRSVTDKLLQERVKAPVPRLSGHEHRSYPYPAASLGGEANVTNRLARQFYADHGVGAVAPAFDLRSSLDGECVMTTPYCIRRETGQCLKERPAYTGELFLRRGTATYRLEFDCAACRMKLIKMNRR